MKPSPLVLALCAVALAPLTAFARLGETPAEIETRFGKGEDDPGSLLGRANPFCHPVRVYHQQGYRITVLFLDGTSAMEHYVREDDQDVTDKQCAELLASNESASRWRKAGGTYWIREDESAEASVHGARFVVTEARLITRAEQEQKKNPAGP